MLHTEKKNTTTLTGKTSNKKSSQKTISNICELNFEQKINEFLHLIINDQKPRKILFYSVKKQTKSKGEQMGEKLMSESPENASGFWNLVEQKQL